MYPRIGPIGVVVSHKVRIINHFFNPDTHGKTKCGLSLDTVSEETLKCLCGEALPKLLNHIVLSEIPDKRILLPKADVTNAFRNIRIAPEDAYYCCYVIDIRYYRVVFPSASLDSGTENTPSSVGSYWTAKSVLRLLAKVFYYIKSAVDCRSCLVTAFIWFGFWCLVYEGHPVLSHACLCLVPLHLFHVWVIHNL